MDFAMNFNFEALFRFILRVSKDFNAFDVSSHTSNQKIMWLEYLIVNFNTMKKMLINVMPLNLF